MFLYEVYLLLYELGAVTQSNTYHAVTITFREESLT